MVGRLLAVKWHYARGCGHGDRNLPLRLLPSNWAKKEKAVRRLAGWKVCSDLVTPHKAPDNLLPWPHNALRHTHASVLVALGKPIESLTFEFGHAGGTQVLKSHYVGVIPKSEAVKIMKIAP